MKCLVLVLLATTNGCAPADVSVERDTAVYELWAKRGQRLGDLAHLFCEQGAERSRDVMRRAVHRYSFPARVTIECEDDATGGPRP